MSLGAVTGGSLNASSGTLTAASKGAEVTAPVNSEDNTSDWNNTALVSQYYAFGKLIPASTTTGATIYKTDDATGVGQTVDAAAVFTATTDTAVAYAKPATNDWDTAYVPGTASATNDDGYYVDIPVWLRTSSQTAVNLSVQALVANLEGEDTELYQAARVAILTSAKAASSNIIPLADTTYDGTSVVDYYDRLQGASNFAVKDAGTGESTDTYGAITSYVDGASVVTVPAATTDTYGDMVKIYVRVWLEGEDPECWNANAGQNFTISLKFTKIESNQGNQGG